MSHHCPITLQPLDKGDPFSPEGLRRLHPRLRNLQPLDLSHDEQLRQARLRADKMSVQGVQPKLSAVLEVNEGRFKVVDQGGQFLLKPNPPPFEEVPANEALTMTLAAATGIEVPPHGLVPSVDGTWVYLIRRFDRLPGNRKLHVEDFAQLSGATRDTKYNSSLEQVEKLLGAHCTSPAVERAALARRLLFCFLTGNEDMHLKNFSLIVRDGRVTMAPAYDLLNTTLVLMNAVEESALSLRGKKRKLTRDDWIDYFCIGRLGLAVRLVDELLETLTLAIPVWRRLIPCSKLSPGRQAAYLSLVEERAERLLAGL